MHTFGECAEWHSCTHCAVAHMMRWTVGKEAKKMSNSNYTAGESESSSGGLGAVAKGGADMFRRAFNVAAREELNQAREETMERLTPVARSTGMMVAGGALAAFGAIYIVQGIVRALSTFMPPWLASLLTGTLIALGGVALIETGRRQVKSPDTDTPQAAQ